MSVLPLEVVATGKLSDAVLEAEADGSAITGAVTARQKTNENTIYENKPQHTSTQ